MKSIHSHHIVTETEVVDGWLTIDDEGRIAGIGDTPVGTRIEEVQGRLAFTWFDRSSSAWLYGLERLENNR